MIKFKAALNAIRGPWFNLNWSFPVFLFLLVGLSGCSSAEPQQIGPSAEYGALAERLTRVIEYEMADKELPAFAIVLVDGQRVVWAQGFGYADPKNKVKATTHTVFRIGSVSKLFTDIGIMQLVEKGRVDLDAPITTYLPDFHPGNPFNKPTTLRQMMSHQSGLLREPRVGNYFDDTEPTLAQTVASLNNSDLIYEPETRIKYSNAGIAVVGYTLEALSGKPFASYLQESVIAPMDLQNSAFVPGPEIESNLAKATMWSYDGRKFAAPSFELGMAPAGSMYATITDLGRFLTVLFNRGKGEKGRVLQAETLESMWTPQFGSDASAGFGLGFNLSEQMGERRVGHGGAIYGFATQLYALPDSKLGVATVTTVDVSNTVTHRIASYALDLLLSGKSGEPFPEFQQTHPVDVQLAHKLEGLYQNDGQKVRLDVKSGQLIISRSAIEAQVRLDKDSSLVVDDRHSYGLKITPLADGSLRIGEAIWKRVPDTKPQPCPERWRGLIGEYGWDHDILYIYEEYGQLWTLIEWLFKYPLKEISEDTFAFPEYGLYEGEKLRFTIDDRGRASRVEILNSVIFERRPVGTESGETFRIEPLKPAHELRQAALQAEPPHETGDFRPPDLVELVKLDPSIKLDIRYATTNNFMSSKFYEEPQAFMQRPAAEAVVRAHKRLKKEGFGLLIHDAYRPWFVTKMFWDATPENMKIFVANPQNGSRHNRGCAVDLTLYDLKTGEAVEMVGGYDEFSDRSFPYYPGGTERQRWHRRLLRKAMEAEGFSVYEFEWWHFDYRDWRHYGIQDLTFEQIGE